MYNERDLLKAREELAYWSEKSNSYSGNNPEKYHADLRYARSRVRLIEANLNKVDKIPLSADALLCQTLDTEYPNAQSNQIVEYNGRKYKRKFHPISKSRTGKTVMVWSKSWEDVS